MSNVLDFINKNFERTIRFQTEDEGNLIGLPLPYTTPCANDTFLEMYYWDTYFTNVGLISHGWAQQAKNNTENMMYLVDKYGFMPNGNRTYYLNRSQPPFLYLCVRDIYNYYGDKEWLKGAFKTLEKEYEFWQTKRQSENGLNFYGNHENLSENDIEVLSKDFCKRTGSAYDADWEMKERMAHTICTYVESGWDCTSRFGYDGQTYNPVDLNSLLYGFENQMAEFCGILENEEKQLWQERAKNRKDKMIKYLWNKEKGIFMDYNFRFNTFSKITSAASLYPMFVGLADNIENSAALLKELLLKYGVAGCTKENCFASMQWDYPNVWAPIQYVAFVAAENYGLKELSHEIAKRYTALIEGGFCKTGNLWEKYDGNTGEIAENEYNAPAMMGWTAGIYLYFKEQILKN